MDNWQIILSEIAKTNQIVNVPIVKSKKRVYTTKIYKHITHKWFSEKNIVQSYVKYAYKIWWLDFVLMLECENWTWKIDKKSEVKGENSQGFCQMNYKYYSRFIDDWRFGFDPFRQLDKCLELWKWWTKFYWYYRSIKWQKCRDVVKNRFILY